MGIGVLLSIQGTAKAVGYSDSYIPYFSLAALGIVFIVILILLRKKKLNFLLGIGLSSFICMLRDSVISCAFRMLHG